MTYLVLARKWRPRSFDTLVGQDHVVRALTHALETQRLHHAWLFTGTRGVGKTTLSRILAKSLNCETGITARPCGQCRACTEIDAGRFVDYLELDAASNRGVEEMTQLLEQAVYAPGAGRFKVYMIDEVHMLTGHAFNAMLKTLEEPPPHVKFILATTDPQKIPVTVLSRCLQFNLKQMPPDAIVGHLQAVLAQESVEFDLPALRLIAQAASGSMRDALSLTDQAIAYSAGNLTGEAVRGMLGTIDQRHLVRLLESLSAGDAPGVLAVADELSMRGLSYAGALADLAVMLSRVAIAQRVPGALPDDDPLTADLVRLGGLLHPDAVQLFYSVAVHSRGELALSPDEYAGFIMACLRMLALNGEAGPATAQQSPPVPAGAQSSASVPAGAAAGPPEAAVDNAGRATGRVALPDKAAESMPGAGSAPATRPSDDSVRGAGAAPVSLPTGEAAAGVPAAEQASVALPQDTPATPAPKVAALAGAQPQNAAEVSAALPVSSGASAQAAPVSPEAGKARSASPADGVPPWEDLPAGHAAPSAAESQPSGADIPPAWVDEAIPDDAYGAGVPDASSYMSDPDDDEFETLAGADVERPMPVRAAPQPRPARARTARARLSDMSAANWPELAARLPVRGLAAELARQSEWAGVHGDTVVLRVAVKTLAESESRVRLQTVLCEHFGQGLRLEVEVGATGDDTAHAVAQIERAARQQAAEEAVAADPFVQALVADFGGRVQPGSIRHVESQSAA